MTIEFTTAEMEQMACVTARQLQWWDEKRVVEPDRSEGRRRVYSAEQAFLVLVIAELRHKGLPLQKVRRILRALQKKLTGPNAFRYLADKRMCLVTDGRVIAFIEESSLVAFLAEARRAVHVVSLSDQARRVRRPFYAVAKAS